MEQAIVEGNESLILQIFDSDPDILKTYHGIYHNLVERGMLYVLGQKIIQRLKEGKGGELGAPSSQASGLDGPWVLNGLKQTFLHNFASNCCIFDEPYKSLFKDFLEVLCPGETELRSLDFQDIFGYTIAHYVMEKHNSAPYGHDGPRCACILKKLKSLGASFDIPNLNGVTVNQMIATTEYPENLQV